MCSYHWLSVFIIKKNGPQIYAYFQLILIFNHSQLRRSLDEVREKLNKPEKCLCTQAFKREKNTLLKKFSRHYLAL